MIVTVKEMKNYLRVDFDDDDVLLSDLIEQGSADLHGRGKDHG